MRMKLIALGLVLMLSGIGYSSAEENTADKAPVKYCLICGPEEETESLSVSYKYKGKKYSFCSMDCLKAFKKDPEKYLSGNALDEKHAGHDHR